MESSEVFGFCLKYLTGRRFTPVEKRVFTFLWLDVKFIQEIKKEFRVQHTLSQAHIFSDKLASPSLGSGQNVSNLITNLIGATRVAKHNWKKKSAPFSSSDELLCYVPLRRNYGNKFIPLSCLENCQTLKECTLATRN